jgi:hypothetical protein
MNDFVDLDGLTFPKALEYTIFSMSHYSYAHISMFMKPNSFRKGIFQQNYKFNSEFCQSAVLSLTAI